MSVIFVFGSNLAGRHGKGSALVALKQFGAVYGVGEGRTGNAYAIPTKDGRHISDLRDPRNVIALERIRQSVIKFLSYAKDHPELEFKVTKIGCGNAGYSESQIKPMFSGAPDNCILPEGWR